MANRRGKSGSSDRFYFIFLQNLCEWWLGCAVLSLFSRVRLWKSMDCRVLCPWDSPGKSIGVGGCGPSQGIFLTRRLIPGLPHCRWILYHRSHQGSLDSGDSHEMQRPLCLGRKSMTDLGSILKSRDIAVYTKIHMVKAITHTHGFSSSHVGMWELDHKEGWALKNWCFKLVGLEKTLESPLDFKEIRLVNPKGNKPWIFIGSSDVEAEIPIHWPSGETS